MIKDQIKDLRHQLEVAGYGMTRPMDEISHTDLVTSLGITINVLDAILAQAEGEKIWHASQ